MPQHCKNWWGNLPLVDKFTLNETITFTHLIVNFHPRYILTMNGLKSTIWFNFHGWKKVLWIMNFEPQKIE